ncbi:hypothetical protein AGMMS49991_07310 [Spirochaetia bacterium]|nr:hypothetical protein AGMMS49991_07310 [Spirochaetia bacterium]
MKKLSFLLALVIAMGFIACDDSTTPDTYVISFDANGGTGGPASSVTATSGEALPALAEANKPQKAGHYFTGYFDAASGGTQYYTNELTSAKNWDKKENTTLYAQWSLIPLTTITFDANGGTGSAMPNQQIEEKTSAALTANTFTRTGYTFGGWAASSDGAKVYDDEGSYTAAAETNSVTLYAVWTAKTYTISFNNSGGTGGPEDVTAIYDQAMPVLTEADKPQNGGYYFSGYFDAASGGTLYYNADLTSAKNWDKDAAGTTTLYAQWTTVPNVTVTFNANGGSGGQTSQVTAIYGAAMPTLTALAPTNETYSVNGSYSINNSPRGNYIGGYVKQYFDGYWDAQTGGKKYYNADLTSASDWDKTGNTELFARWLTAAQKYNITLGNDDITAYFVDTPPTIDGLGNDPAWAKAKWMPLCYEWMFNPPLSHVTNADDFSGRFKIVWTADRLYILGELIDDIISFQRESTPTTNPENDDCFELFIDENASGGARNTEGGNNLFTYHISYGGVNVVDYVGGSTGSVLRNHHLNYKIDKNDATHTYTWEIEMKVYNNTYPVATSPETAPVILTEGKKIGIAAAYCDADGNNKQGSLNARDHFIGSFNAGNTTQDWNQGYQNSTQYAKLYLVK